MKIDRFSGRYRRWAAGLLSQRWGSPLVVSRGRLHNVLGLTGFVAVQQADGEERPVGLLTVRPDGSSWEIVTLDVVAPSESEGKGENKGDDAGQALLAACEKAAREAQIERLWLITTNDNEAAQAFYKAQGFTIAGVYKGAVAQARRLKPQIPLTSPDGVPIEDEIEFSKDLTDGNADNA